eukprot:665605-Amphidinium_carterae.1
MYKRGLHLDSESSKASRTIENDQTLETSTFDHKPLPKLATVSAMFFVYAVLCRWQHANTMSTVRSKT